MRPRVSVLMSVHNGERYLREAVESILRQRFDDFELIVIDDGSTDHTPTLLDGYSDARIVRLRNSENIGLTRSLNRSLAVARGEFVARQDADDVSLPERLAAQVDFLDKHGDIGVLGARCRLIDAQSRERAAYYQLPTTALEVRWVSLLANPFWHSTVMIRRDVLTRYRLTYDESCTVTQDYDLWTRVLRHTDGANLPMPLLLYRVHANLSRRFHDEQMSRGDVISLRTVREQLPDFEVLPEQVRGLRELFAGDQVPSLWAMESSRALTALYIALFRAFTVLHQGEPGMPDLPRFVALNMIRAASQVPVGRGLTIFRLALSLAPRVMCPLLAQVPWMVWRRMTRQASVPVDRDAPAT